MIAAAKVGYRAVAIDFRGYGESEIPSEPEKATFKDFVDDVVGILDFLEIPKIFIVGKDFGAQVVYTLAILHPERVLGVVTLGIPFIPAALVSQLYSALPQGFYVMRWMIPGRAEADFRRFDVKTVIKKIYILFSGSTVPIAEENQEIMDLIDSAAPLPSWFKEEDLSAYATLYEKSGFSTPLTVPYSGSSIGCGVSTDARPMQREVAPIDPPVGSHLLTKCDKVVVFLHGFPEIWYSWRHQMIVVAKVGYRAIAPDFRGYGLSEVPSEPAKTTFMDLIDDLLAILDSFGIPKVFIVGKDFGGRPAYHLALLHPQRVSGLVTLGVPYLPPGHSFSVQEHPPEGLYVLRWQKPGRAEADFGRFDVNTVVKNIYILFSRSELPIAEENKEVMDLVDPSTPLANWFTEEDLSVYASLYEKSGFCTPLQVPYRSLKEHSSVTSTEIMAPALMIMGEKDYTLKFNGIEEYITNGKVKEYVPNLETVYVPDGSHFIQEQFPDKVNQLLTSFLSNHI